MQRYSKNREAILNCLRSTKTHPTAEWIYLQLKEDLPNLSLATVYRNLTALKEHGDIRSMGIVGGQERFDAINYPHSHVVCARCGAVIDVPEIPIPGELIARVEKETGCTVTETALQFNGLCAVCAKKEKPEA